jgi:hypothetical protein
MWRESLRNRVSIIIIKYTDHMKVYCVFHILLVLLCFILYMVVFFYASIQFCILCIRFVMFMCSYCYECSILGIMFHCVVLHIVCV